MLEYPKVIEPIFIDKPYSVFAVTDKQLKNPFGVKDKYGLFSFGGGEIHTHFIGSSGVMHKIDVYIPISYVMDILSKWTFISEQDKILSIANFKIKWLNDAEYFVYEYTMPQLYSGRVIVNYPNRTQEWNIFTRTDGMDKQKNLLLRFELRNLNNRFVVRLAMYDDNGKYVNSLV